MVSWRHSYLLRNQEARRVRDIGSLIFETPIQHDYKAGVEVRSLLPTERLEELDGRLAITDEDSNGNRYLKVWVDDAPGVRLKVGTLLQEEKKHLVVPQYTT